MVIKVKGRTPENKYDFSLPETFTSLGDKVFTMAECVSRLNENGLWVDEKRLFRELFGYRPRKERSDAVSLPYSFAGPFQMRSVVHGQFNFNLQYQDVVIKIELEKRFGREKDLSELNIILHQTLENISILLRTAIFTYEPLYLELTNMELDHIVMRCLALMWQEGGHPMDNQDPVAAGHAANQIAYLVQEKILSANKIDINNILPFLLFSGVVWWSDPEIQSDFHRSPEELVQQLTGQLSEYACQSVGVNDFPIFREEVIESKPHKRLLLFLDDNGELVWESLFIRLLLDVSPNLTIKCVVNSIPITNNANVSTLQGYLASHGKFLNLLDDSRFEIVGELNELPAIDLRFISPELKEIIGAADIYLVNGVSFFEKIQYMPKPTYYLFTVYSETSRILTGFERNIGIFARLGPHMCGFSHIRDEDSRAVPKMVLKGIHSALQSTAYKDFVHGFDNEADANLWLLDESVKSAQTVEEIIYRLGTSSK